MKKILIMNEIMIFLPFLKSSKFSMIVYYNTLFVKETAVTNNNNGTANTVSNRESV